MLNDDHAPASPAGQPDTPVREQKKRKPSLAAASPDRTENHPSAIYLTAAKAAAAAAEEAAAAAEAASVKAANAASAARSAADAAAEAVRDLEALEAAQEAVKEVEALEAAQEVHPAVAPTKAKEEATAEKAAGKDLGGLSEYQKSQARTTFLYVPVEGDIQVRLRSTARTEEILEWPYTEGHLLWNDNLMNEPYGLAGFVRCQTYNGPVNERYSRIYGDGTMRIRGPVMIVKEQAGKAVSLTEEDIPKIFT